jgi:hypothetical protein
MKKLIGIFQVIFFLFSWHTNFYFTLRDNCSNLCYKGVIHLHLREARGQSG